MQLEETHKYDDIIHLSHHVSATRAGMPVADRAAQFSPFAALTGYEDVIEESGRLTDKARQLTEGSVQTLDHRLALIRENLHTLPQITVTYFQPDSRKSGGSYLTVTGQVKRIDEYEKMLRFADGRCVPLEAIYRLEGELLDRVED